MYQEAKRSAWVEINLTHLISNNKNSEKVGAETKIIGIIQADG